MDRESSPNYIQAFEALYKLGVFVMFMKLTFFDNYDYNAWNWIVAIPLNLLFAILWPISIFHVFH